MVLPFFGSEPPGVPDSGKAAPFTSQASGVIDLGKAAYASLSPLGPWPRPGGSGLGLYAGTPVASMLPCIHNPFLQSQLKYNTNISYNFQQKSPQTQVYAFLQALLPFQSHLPALMGG